MFGIYNRIFLNKIYDKILIFLHLKNDLECRLEMAFSPIKRSLRWNWNRLTGGGLKKGY